MSKPPAGYEYQQAKLYWPGGDVVAIQWDPTSVYVGHGSNSWSMPFDPAVDSWVRLRPTAGSTIVELSGDGYTWTMLAIDPVPPPSSAGIELVGGIYNPTPSPQPIVFDGMNACP